MGEEIERTEFTDADRAAFAQRLADETALLKQTFAEHGFARLEKRVFGMEVEGWLLDKDHLPAPRNDDFLAAAQSELLVEELAQFNFEMNTTPHPLSGQVFLEIERELRRTWARCRTASRKVDVRPAVFGILPTVRDEMLQPEYMSDRNRYRALADQIARLRGHEPLRIVINGYDVFELKCDHIMLEAACTSIQTHLQVNQEDAARYMNAFMIVSAPSVAASANSPFLYGKALWDESRIPAFERALRARGDNGATALPERVTFGSGYVEASLFEQFQENIDLYPPLLPLRLDEPPARFKHLRLHNGTLWRWNRPIIGFEDDGQPHLRIEHRVMPAGPTIIDMMANAAFAIGLAVYYANQDIPPEKLMSFEDAKHNFYEAARDGLKAEINWLGRRASVQALMLDQLIEEACAGLAMAGVSEADCERYLSVVMHRRMLTGRTGAEWQRSFIDVHGANFQALTEAYVENQMTGEPVHEWIV